MEEPEIVEISFEEFLKQYRPRRYVSGPGEAPGGVQVHRTREGSRHPFFYYIDEASSARRGGESRQTGATTQQEASTPPAERASEPAAVNDEQAFRTELVRKLQTLRAKLKKLRPVPDMGGGFSNMPPESAKILFPVMEDFILAHEEAFQGELGVGRLDVGLSAGFHSTTLTLNGDTPNGRVSVSRNISLGPKVTDFYRSLFKLPPSMQGSGLAKKLEASIQKQAKALANATGKPTMVHMNANLDVGGYAWAKFGYDFAQHRERLNIRNMIESELSAMEDNKYRELARDIKLSPVDREEARVQYIAASQGLRYQLNKMVQSRAPAYKFAMFGYAFKDDRGYHIGKRAMLGSNWDGIMYVFPDAWSEERKKTWTAEAVANDHDF